MKDLKHLLYFEDLIQNANNELIQQARDNGGVCVRRAAHFWKELSKEVSILPTVSSPRTDAP